MVMDFSANARDAKYREVLVRSSIKGSRKHGDLHLSLEEQRTMIRWCIKMMSSPQCISYLMKWKRK